jgi:hypothetical protein
MTEGEGVAGNPKSEIQDGFLTELLLNRTVFPAEIIKAKTAFVFAAQLSGFVLSSTD